MTLRAGAVAIGRNEGVRLQRCLQSLVGKFSPVVYVDSGSTDDSVAFARSLDVEVVELDMSKPFTMARGRNAGWQRLLELDPELDLIQFVDGDVELVPTWFSHASQILQNDPSIVIVSGRRRERNRNDTIYNQLVDMEWDTPVGQTQAVLGDMLVRAQAVTCVNGFDPNLIAAEDDEFCLRVVKKCGGTIVRVEHDMSVHDAAMHKFSQWWKRMQRAGYGFAHVGSLHQTYFRKERLRTWIWALGLPALILLLAWPTYGVSLLGLLLYPFSYWRTQRWRQRRGDSPRDARLYAFFTTLSKFPSLLGMLQFYKRRMLNQANTIIEYK